MTTIGSYGGVGFGARIIGKALLIGDDLRYKTQTLLNNALLRTAMIRQQYDSYDGEFYRFNAALSPKEFQANLPVPLVFTKEEIWARADQLERESEYLVQQFRELVHRAWHLEDVIIQQRSSPNFALVQADVLKWDIDRRFEGLETQRAEYIEQIRYFLKFPPTSQVQGAALYRS